MTYAKPLPEPDIESRPFWDAAREHRLVIQRCLDCGAHRFPAATFCAACRSDRSEWVQASGKGRVFSWIVVNHPVPKDVYGPDVPYVVALVTLEEGVRLVSNIVGCDPSAVVADMPVRVTFDDVTDKISLPRFRPEASRA